MKKLFLILFSSSLALAQFPNVRISSPSSYDPEILAAGANINYFYASYDGGKNWTQKRLSSSLGVWGDPCVLFDDSGNLFFAHLSNPLQGYWIDRIVVQRSTDNGVTWNDGAGVGFRSPRNQDKEWLAVDLTSSQYHGNIYMSWTEFDSYGSSEPKDRSRILFSYSTDSGISWSEPITISDITGNCIDSDNTAEGAVPAVGPNGEIYIAWSLNDSVYFDKSLDGGKTFGRDKVIMVQPGGWDYQIPGINRANGMPVTACDISNSPYRGNIYVLTSDQRNGIDNTDIFLVKSTDGGETWSDEIRVNQDSTSRHQFLCWMTVDPVTGYVYVSYYDRRNTTGAATDYYLSRSTDGGDTFQDFKISDSSFTPLSFVFFGDYTNIAAYNGRVYPIWMRLDNTRLSVWTALIEDSVLVTSAKNPTLIVPENFSVMQNYPNPFNPQTTIPFKLNKPGKVKLTVFDALGKRIIQMNKYYETPGAKELSLDLGKYSSGIYIYTISFDGLSYTKKMTLLK